MYDKFLLWIFCFYLVYGYSKSAVVLRGDGLSGNIKLQFGIILIDDSADW